ncbi:MAG: leucyl aminopeptidase [Cellvibrionaceae bacterium]
MAKSNIKFSAKTLDLNTLKADCVIVAAFSKTKLSSYAKQLDKNSDINLKSLYKSGEFTGKKGELLPIYQPTSKIDKAIVLGFGDKSDISSDSFRQAIASVAKALKKSPAKNIALLIDDVEVTNWSAEDKSRTCAQTFVHTQYTFTRCKSSDGKKVSQKAASITYSSIDLRLANKGLKIGQAIGDGMNVARELGDLPGNICTPNYLAGEARKLAKKHTSLKTQILSEKQMKALGMGSLLSVSAGSKEPAQLIVMEYQGAAKTTKPHVLVGKGITFDTGGISLKPGAAMDEMKYDMCGAASVFGTFEALLALKPKLNVVGIVAAAENMPGSQATKPGDIVTSMSGKTIEVLNTDAEGRLVLCDALSYAEKYKPQSVVDIATLTGACVVALGKHASGLYSNDEGLAQSLLNAGISSGDRAWQMPLWDDYQKQLNSNFADMANIGGRDGGSITAACFLSRFTESYKWAHLDIAGTAWHSGAAKGATGRPVPLLTEYLLGL